MIIGSAQLLSIALIFTPLDHEFMNIGCQASGIIGLVLKNSLRSS